MPLTIADLAPTLIAQIISIDEKPTHRSVVIIKCVCGVERSVEFRSLCRKWAGKPNYLCRSCHIKTYISNPERIAKQKISFAKIAKTKEHRQKCSDSGKLAWTDPIIRARITAAVTLDNQINPKKAKSRAIALAALQQKPWFRDHLAKINEISCLVNRSNELEFITKARLIHRTEYDYSKVKYINSTTNVDIKCPEHGLFKQTPHNHLCGKGCRYCNYKITRQHQLIIDWLSPIVDIIINDRKKLESHEIDVWIPVHNLGIEINGEYWHGVHDLTDVKRLKRQRFRHNKKANIAIKAGIKLFQFWEFELIKRPAIVHSMIKHALGLSHKIYARKCIINQLKDNEACNFLDMTHLQGRRSASLHYALELDNDIVCVLSLSQYRENCWEIIRYSNKLNSTVVGGFSRLLNRFIIDHKPKEIMTFADYRFSTGNVYLNNGFTFLYVTKPNYFYIKGSTILSRQKCQKHKLAKLLGVSFNSNLTEHDNMIMAGFTKVYDAGHSKFIRTFEV